MKEFKLEWGRVPLGRDLNVDEVKILLDTLQSKADGVNVFHANFLPAEIEFIRENVENAHLIPLSDINYGSYTECVVGIDEETAKHEVSKI